MNIRNVLIVALLAVGTILFLSILSGGVATIILALTTNFGHSISLWLFSTVIAGILIFLGLLYGGSALLGRFAGLTGLDTIGRVSLAGICLITAWITVLFSCGVFQKVYSAYGINPVVQFLTIFLSILLVLLTTKLAINQAIPSTMRWWGRAVIVGVFFVLLYNLATGYFRQDYYNPNTGESMVWTTASGTNYWHKKPPFKFDPETGEKVVLASSEAISNFQESKKPNFLSSYPEGVVLAEIKGFKVISKNRNSITIKLTTDKPVRVLDYWDKKATIVMSVWSEGHEPGQPNELQFSTTGIAFGEFVPGVEMHTLGNLLVFKGKIGSIIVLNVNSKA